jgi:hypothetical protein
LFISRFNFGCGTIFRLANHFLVVCQTALSSRNAQNLSFSFFRFSLRCLAIRSRYKLTDKSLNFMSLNQCFLATFQNSANFSKPIDSLPVATLQSCKTIVSSLYFSHFSLSKITFCSPKLNSGHYLSQCRKRKNKFFPRKSAGNCAPSKTSKVNKFCRYRKVQKSRSSGQFIKDFSANESVFFFYYDA